MKLSKENILHATNGGHDVFKHILLVNGQEWITGKNCHNPFYKDENPSLSISERNGLWLFNDFGNSDYSGDCFDFAAHYYGHNARTEFVQILESINRDLNLGLDTFVRENGKPEKNQPNVTLADFDNNDEIFWNDFGIDLKILNRFNVFSVANFTITDDKSNDIVIKKTQNPIFAYKISESCFKIYQPLNPKYKFSWIGNKSKDYIFGMKQLDYTKDFVIITGGEKDVMALSAQGYNAICLNSETADFPKNIITEIKKDFRNILVLYDLDKTGENNAQKLENLHKLCKIELPDKLKEYSGKDVSDYIKLCGLHPNQFNIEELADIVKYGIERSTALNEGLDLIPRELYSVLPKEIRYLIDLETEFKHKEIALMSILTACSSICKVKSTYDGKTVYPNFYTYIVGRPASNKGLASLSRDMLYYVDQYVSRKNEPNDYPKSKLVTAGNLSQIAFIELLSKNPNGVMLIETEAEGMIQVNKNEWGATNDSLLKAFHHESIGATRKTDKMDIDNKNPKISVLITSTPNQFKEFFGRAENGIFSRFLLYYIGGNVSWRNPYKSIKSKDAEYRNIGKELLKLWKYFYDGNDDYWEFKLSNEQIDDLNKFMESILNEFKAIHYYDNKLDSASIFRLGLILHRLSIVITVLRQYFENGTVDKHIICDDQSYLLAKAIVQNAYLHLKAGNEILKKGNYNAVVTNMELFYKQMPEREISRKEAIALASKLNVKEDYVDKILNHSGAFRKTRRGYYIKRHLSAESVDKSK